MLRGALDGEVEAVRVVESSPVGPRSQTCIWGRRDKTAAGTDSGAASGVARVLGQIRESKQSELAGTRDRVGAWRRRACEDAPYARLDRVERDVELAGSATRWDVAKHLVGRAAELDSFDHLLDELERGRACAHRRRTIWYAGSVSEVQRSRRGRPARRRAPARRGWRAELAKDVAQVRLDGLRAEEELGGDLGVGLSSTTSRASNWSGQARRAARLSDPHGPRSLRRSAASVAVPPCGEAASDRC